MATWDITHYIQECEKCGKKYNVTKHEQPVREKGVFNCQCGHQLECWNGGVDYTFSEIKEQ
ncbi:hypothetical protein [Salinivibrio sp. ES.052]|uniref:hypothetical protein n=1 Tax=Salinivibrio sp. ES.052 TaxID=1882823 RepID=UPI000929E9FD|nr:hypothetical protein [Salinivibrio sp. ES.052]SIO33223.1 hypothetical protein SAMN05444724_2750 [Salinivibrio sp. ES.052]